MTDLNQAVLKLAQAEGFDLAGIVSLDGVPDSTQRADYLEEWIAAGHAGEMDYLKRRDEHQQLLRSSIETAFPWARSVVVCAVNYNAEAPHSIDPAPPGTGWMARYAWSGTRDENGDITPTDYHDVLLKRLRSLEDRLKSLLLFDQARSYVDTGPVIERAYAHIAGIGWTGKNTCILNQQLGSWLFLGVIVTSYEVPAHDRELAILNLPADRCGTCRRCIEACPTDALIAPYEMDASRCISYLTIEKRGAIDPSLGAKIGRQLFGCDICQDVCPWNRRAPVTEDAEFYARPELVNPDLSWLAELDSASFNKYFKGSPIKRAKLKGLQRNVAIAMGNSGDQRFKKKLEEWSLVDDPVLSDTAQRALIQIREAAPVLNGGEAK